MKDFLFLLGLLPYFGAFFYFVSFGIELGHSSVRFLVKKIRKNKGE